MLPAQPPAAADATPFWGAGPADSPAQFFQQLPVPVGVLLGPALVHEQVNPAYQQLFSGRELVGRPWAEAMPELAAHPLAQALRAVYETGVPLAGHEVLPVPSAAGAPDLMRYVRFSGQARHNAAGQIDGVLVFAHEAHSPVPTAPEPDLELVRMEEVLTQIPALVALLYGPNHQFTFVNPAYQSIFPDRQLVGQTFADALPEAYAQGYGAWLNQTYSTGETVMAYDNPLRFRNAQGEEQESYFDFTYSTYGQEGQQKLMVVAFDVTERVEARQARAARQQQLLAIFEQAPAALAILHGPEFVVEMANASICAMWDRKLEQVIGRSLFETLPEIMEQGYKELLHGVRQTGQPYVAREQGVNLLRNGRYGMVYFDFLYQPLLDEQGRTDDIAVVATDVTAQVTARQRVEELNQVLTTLNEQLRTNNDALSEKNDQLARTKLNLETFLDGAWHELNTSLSALEALLKDGLLPPLPTTKMMDQLRRVATRFQPPG